VVGLRGRRRTAAALVPSLRSLAVGLALVVAAAAAYVAARETSAFALRTVVVEGGSPRLAGDVRRALSPLVGRSLVEIAAGDVLARVEALPEVRAVSYDRAFPHTLVVVVHEEHAAAVLRAGRDAWLVSARGRVLRRTERGRRSGLARVWVPAGTSIVPGERVDDGAARRAVAAAAVARREFGRRVLTAEFARGQLTFRLSGGRELRLGDDADVALKLAVAAAILAKVPEPQAGGPTYVDVSFPERSVTGGTLKSKVEIEG
jgi:hypothetical protein